MKRTLKMDRNMMPDPAFYVDCLQKSYDELKVATIEKPRKSPRKKAAKKSASKKAKPNGNGAVQPSA